MPATTRVSPDSNVTLGITEFRRFFDARSLHHIYFALGAVAIFLLARFVAAQLVRRFQTTHHQWARIDHKQETEVVGKGKNSWSLEGKRGGAACWLETGITSSGRNCLHLSAEQYGTERGFTNPIQKSYISAGFPSRAQASLSGQSWHLLAMDGDVSEQGEKDHSGSATSRGVSTNIRSAADIRRQHNPSRDGALSGSSAEQRRTNSQSSRSSRSQASSFRGQSSDPNGADSSGSQGTGEGKGKEPMTSEGNWFQGVQGLSREETRRPLASSDSVPWAGSTQSSSFPDLENLSTSTSWQFSRAPPPPPLTPPTLNDSIFPFENRRLSYAVSIPPELDSGFIHQENPDYLSSSATAIYRSPSPQSTTGIGRPQSYGQSAPIGIPTPTASASSSAEAIASPSPFSPSSFPPRAPILPPPPPSSDAPYGYQFVGGPGGPGVLHSEEEVDLHGEVMSVTEHTGHGWTRHTRVYGGGVCLACVAAGGEGGFYGDKVPLEDRR